MNRAIEIAGFLSQSGWDAASHDVMEADYSPRRYARLERDDGAVAVLMDADPDQRTAQFVLIARYLRSKGLRAPEIFAAQPQLGLVLMEDLGSRNVGKLLDHGNAARPLYQRAVDLLLGLHAQSHDEFLSTSGLPHFNAQLFLEQVCLFLQFYMPFALGREATMREGERFGEIWSRLLAETEALPQTLMLRDFMPDNLIDITTAELGVLDFQDGGKGPIAYDLASLCETVRRKGGEDHEPWVIDYYLEHRADLDRGAFRHAFFILSTQRHMRVLGILARLVQKGRSDKRAHMDRVETHLRHILGHQVMTPLAAWFNEAGLSLSSSRTSG